VLRGHHWASDIFSLVKYSGRRWFCKTLKDIDDLAVRNLTKIRVISADGAERFVILKADDVVSLAAQLGNLTRWRHGDRENEFFGTAHAGGAQGCADGCPGGDAVIDYDCGVTADFSPLPPT